MKKKQKQNKLPNPKCLVNLLHYEATGKSLYCEKCPIADRCEKYQVAKDFQETK